MPTKLEARRAKEQATGTKARGKAPKPPELGPRPQDQDNFTAPESRIMPSGGTFEESDNAQAAVDTATMLIVGEHVSDAPNDKEQLLPTLKSSSVPQSAP